MTSFPSENSDRFQAREVEVSLTLFPVQLKHFAPFLSFLFSSVCFTFILNFYLFQDHYQSCPNVAVTCDRCGKTDIPRGQVGLKYYLT